MHSGWQRALNSLTNMTSSHYNPLIEEPTITLDVALEWKENWQDK